MSSVGRKAPKGERHVQSIRFKKAQWTEEKARTWVKNHDKYVDGLDVSANEYRFR